MFIKCWFQIKVHTPHSLRLSSIGIFLVLRTGALTSWRIQKTERTLRGPAAGSLNNTRHPSPPHPPPPHEITKVNQQWFPQYQETLLLTYNWLVSFLGVLFSKATHYLPLNFTREDKTKLVDMRGNATGMVFNTINASTAEQIGQVLRLNGIDNYIELNNLKDECITNPSKCTEGLSVAFWIKYTEGK